MWTGDEHTGWGYQEGKGEVCKGRDREVGLWEGNEGAIYGGGGGGGGGELFENNLSEEYC